MAAGLGASGAVGALLLLGAVDDEPVPVTTTTTTTTTTTEPIPPDPVEVLSAALAHRLADDAGVDAADEEVRCLAVEAVEILGEDRLIAMVDEAPEAGEALTEDERAGLVRAVVECLGPVAAGAVLGDGTGSEAPVLGFPDDGAEEGGP
jgi:hypothetical protein